MRRCRAALTALTLALMSLLIAGPAQAGGPTSVLLVVPGSGQTASLYASDADYDTLARTVGAFSDTGTAGKVDSSGAEHATGPGVTLTWLIHDVSVWRVDRVYLDAKGGPWISTQTDLSGQGNIWDKPPVWHTAVDAKLLAALLQRLGVDGFTPADSAEAGSSPVQPDVASGQGAAGTTTDPAPPAEEQASDPAGPNTAMLGWGLGGVALGVALTLLVARLRPRFASSQYGSPAVTVPDTVAEPAAGPGPDGPDGPDWSAAEELPWPAQRR